MVKYALEMAMIARSNTLPPPLPARCLLFFVCHESPVTCHQSLFPLTPFYSYSYRKMSLQLLSFHTLAKTKDLKLPRIILLQKHRGEGVPNSQFLSLTSNL